MYGKVGRAGLVNWLLFGEVVIPVGKWLQRWELVTMQKKQMKLFVESIVFGYV